MNEEKENKKEEEKLDMNNVKKEEIYPDSHIHRVDSVRYVHCDKEYEIYRFIKDLFK